MNLLSIEYKIKHDDQYYLIKHDPDSQHTAFFHDKRGLGWSLIAERKVVGNIRQNFLTILKTIIDERNRNSN